MRRVFKCEMIFLDLLWSKTDHEDEGWGSSDVLSSSRRRTFKFESSARALTLDSWDTTMRPERVSTAIPMSRCAQQYVRGNLP